MLTQVAGPLRVARAGLVATLVLALAALAHRVGGGTLPDPLILAALAAFTMAGATFAARFRLTFARLVAVLGTGQVALHYGLGFGAGVTCAPAAGAAAGHAGHGAAAQVSACASGTPLLPDGVAHLPHETPAGAWMVLAHVLATLVVALVVAHGERALGLLLAWLAPRTALTDMLPALPVAHRLPTPVVAPSRATTVHLRIPTTRGPPLLARPVALPS
ncbi:hypothetical protein [Oerskovia enterophila]|uniref:Uncharacterized protein n=1 Tax=Oerskovia enterophila TaxID=43678 RepID=A0A163R362_9CELL|nr:hypothetical protein [Oerskovia enterophila]KZM34804.1 hypothetical protein OJAG_26100 [Oerskovia enterophila]